MQLAVEGGFCCWLLTATPQVFKLLDVPRTPAVKNKSRHSPPSFDQILPKSPSSRTVVCKSQLVYSAVSLGGQCSIRHSRFDGSCSNASPSWECAPKHAVKYCRCRGAGWYNVDALLLCQSAQVFTVTNISEAELPQLRVNSAKCGLGSASNAPGSVKATFGAARSIPSAHCCKLVC